MSSENVSDQQFHNSSVNAFGSQFAMRVSKKKQKAKFKRLNKTGLK